MREIRDIWNNSDIRCGGFYEMAIQVSDNKSIEPIRKLTKAVFNIDFINGPYDNDFNNTQIDLEYFENIGLIKIENKFLPFKTYHISEEGDDGNNWLDISIYTGILEEILGKEYKTWDTNSKLHEGVDKLLVDLLKVINSRFKIKLGILGFEVSGMYDLEWLMDNELKNADISHTRFYIDSDNFNLINPVNYNNVIKI